MSITNTSAPCASDGISFQKYAQQFEYDVNNNLIYFGEAPVGTSTATALWRIMKLFYDVNNNLIYILWANGNPNEVNVWDNRATYTYS